MKKSLKGFTVIELVIVIVIISILTTFAISRFIDQTSTARTNSINSLASALAAASAANYAQRSANSLNGTSITNCNQIGNLIQNGLPFEYTITSASINAGSSVNCNLTNTNGTSATFVGLGIN